MARSAGSLSSQDAKLVAQEIETLTGIPCKKNFDYLRLIELIVCFRIAEQVRDASNIDESDFRSPVTVEIPLIGNLTIHPRVFHKTHRLTDKPSIHFDYTFTPSSGFKADVYRAFESGGSSLPSEYSALYGKRLQEIYKSIEGGD